LYKLPTVYPHCCAMNCSQCQFSVIFLETSNTQSLHVSHTDVLFMNTLLQQNMQDFSTALYKPVIIICQYKGFTFFVVKLSFSLVRGWGSSSLKLDLPTWHFHYTKHLDVYNEVGGPCGTYGRQGFVGETW